MNQSQSQTSSAHVLHHFTILHHFPLVLFGNFCKRQNAMFSLFLQRSWVKHPSWHHSCPNFIAVCTLLPVSLYLPPPPKKDLVNKLCHIQASCKEQPQRDNPITNINVDQPDIPVCPQISACIASNTGCTIARISPSNMVSFQGPLLKSAQCLISNNLHQQAENPVHAQSLQQQALRTPCTAQHVTLQHTDSFCPQQPTIVSCRRLCANVKNKSDSPGTRQSAQPTTSSDWLQFND